MRGIHTPLRHSTGTCSRAQGSNGLRTATVLGVEGGGRGEGGGDTHTDSRHEDVRARNSKFELLVRNAAKFIEFGKRAEKLTCAAQS